MLKKALIAGITFVSILTLPYVTAHRGLDVAVLHAAYTVLSGSVFYLVLFGRMGLNLIGGAIFGAWWLFNTMGFARLSVLAEFDRATVVFAYLLTFAGTVILTFGYLLGYSVSRGRSRYASLSSSTVVRAGTSNRLALWVMLAGFALLAAQMWAAGGAAAYFSRPYAEKLPSHLANVFFVLRGMVRDGAFYFALAGLGDPSVARPLKALLFAYLVIHLVTVIGSGGTGGLIGFALSPFLLIVGCDYRNMRPRVVKFLLGVVIVTAFIAGALRQLRGDPASLGVRALLDASRPARVINFMVYSHSFDLLENTVRIINYYPAAEGAGSQFIYPLVNLLPRALFPWKPQGLGAQIVRDIYGAPADTPVSFVPGVLGELYYDFGYILGGLVLLLYGIVIGTLQAILRLGRNSQPYATSMVVHLAMTLNSFPNSYTGAGIRLEFALIFWGLLHVGSRLMAATNRRTKHKGHTLIRLVLADGEHHGAGSHRPS